VSSLGFSWVGNCALRFYRSLEENASKFFFNLLFSTIVTTTAIIAIVSLAWIWLPEKYQGILLISGPLTMLLGVVVVLNNVLRAQSKAVAFSLFQGLTVLARFLPGIVAVAWISSEVKSFVAAWTLGTLGVVILLIIYTGSQKAMSTRKPDGALLGEFFRYGIPITAVSAMGIIINTADRYIIDIFRPPSAVAIYGVSYQLGSMSILIISRAIMMAVLPRAIDTHELGQEYTKVATRGLRYFLLAAFSVLAVVGVPAPQILAIYAGAGYEAGGNVLRLVMLAIFMMSLAHYFRMPFLINRRTSTLLIIGMLPAISSIVLNLVLVPAYGSVGSALALLLSYSLMLLMSIYFSKQIVRIKWPAATIGRCMMALAVVLAIAWITRCFLELSSLALLGLAMTGWMLVYGLVLTEDRKT